MVQFQANLTTGAIASVDGNSYEILEVIDATAAEYSYKKIEAAIPEDIGDSVFIKGSWQGNIGISNGGHTALDTGFDWTQCESVLLVFNSDSTLDSSDYIFTDTIDVSTFLQNPRHLIDRYDDQHAWLRAGNAGNVSALSEGKIEIRILVGSGWYLVKAVGYGKKSIKSVVSSPQATVQTGIAEVAGAGATQTNITFPTPFTNPPNVQVSLIWNYNASSNGSLTNRGLVLDGEPNANSFTVRGVGDVNALDKISWSAISAG